MKKRPALYLVIRCKEYLCSQHKAFRKKEVQNDIIYTNTLNAENRVHNQYKTHILSLWKQQSTCELQYHDWTNAHL